MKTTDAGGGASGMKVGERAPPLLVGLQTETTKNRTMI